MADCGCTETNPCPCLGGAVATVVAITPCPVAECCLKACDGIIKCENSVGPCGQVGQYDLNELKPIKTECKDNSLVFRITEFDVDIFASVAVTTAGVLTFKTKGEATAGKYGEICYKISCLTKSDCSDCFELRANGVLTVGVKDICLGNTCDECETCNPCTAICEEDDVNITGQVV